jgi:hypothetical protein
MEEFQNDLIHFGAKAYSLKIDKEKLSSHIRRILPTSEEWENSCEALIKPWILKGFPQKAQDLINIDTRAAKRLGNVDKKQRRADMNRLSRILRDLHDAAYTEPKKETRAEKQGIFI